MVEPRNTDNLSASGRAGLQPSGTSESHPLATGAGVAGGSAAGAAAGTLAGPVGTVVGAVAGAVVGGLGGRAVGQAFDPVQEDRYWRQHYADEPYVEAGRTYDDYGPAYTLGMSGRQNYGGSFDDAQERLSQEWARQHAGSSLSWQQAREPSRAAWQRVASQYPLAGESALGGAVGDHGSTTVRAGREASSAQADLGLGLDSGRTYSTDSSASRSERIDSHGPGQSNTLLSSADLQGRKDARLPGSTSFEAGMGAMGAVGQAQSASMAQAHDWGDTGETVDVLNDLIECCRDGEYGFRLCAQHTQQPELKRVLGQHAEECQQSAQELMDCIGQLGGQIDDGSSLMGSMHRGWVSVKGTLSGYSDRAMLDEAERGEDTAMARYHHALDEQLPPAVHALVQRQAESVKRKLDDVKSWRNRLQDRA